MAGSLNAVTLGKVFALEGHAVLYGDTAAKLLDAIDVFLGHGFCMVKEPVQAIERDLAVDLFKHVQHTADGFVVGRMQAERPAMLDQVAYDTLQLVFHAWRQIRARLQEVFEVRGGKHQHFTCAIMAEEVTALARRQHVGPFFEIFQFMPRPLGKQVVSDA
ncbi:hypothetical protein D3C80_1342590 [compost metagenome]